ncbi:MAG: phenylalanine--tRNA ligase subunit beta [Desulfobacterales bacterium]
MKASISWLKEYVPIEMDIDALADGLTMAGLEVDGVLPRYEGLDPVVIGKIVDVQPHPHSAELKICDVDVGDRHASIVCGAPNVTAGVFAPLAFPGTRFPDGFVLEGKDIHGVPSDGMLCSEAELGLGADDSGIMILDGDRSIGEPLTTALGLSDTVLDIDLTPNRADCLSMLGIAREIAAFGNVHVRYPATHLPEGKGRLADIAAVTIEAPDHCPRYGARLVEDITVAPSPFWLQDRLLSIGLRPINNIVDITNFVMMETGQPLHAFDFNHLNQSKIVVRLAHEGESFTTIDRKEHSLTGDMLMICDGEKPVALAGIMGGLNSEIEAGSTSVLIESACFNPVTIRRAAKRLGLSSEASHRFERGVDPDGTIIALNRAAQLMVDIAGGTLTEGLIDQHPKPIEIRKIPLSIRAVNRFLGTDLDLAAAEALLTSIECKVDVLDDDRLEVVPPSFRIDIKQSVDLMEEIARLWGYNNILTTYPSVIAEARPLNKGLYQRDRAKDIMVGLGFTETINYSFIDPASCDRLQLEPDDRLANTVSILNPLSEDQAILRSSLIPGLLDTTCRNIAQQVKTLKLFEVGKIFIKTRTDLQPEEIEMMAGLWTGTREDGSWYGRETACDFYDIKGVVEGLFDGLDIGSVAFTRSLADRCRYTRPGHTAEIRINDERVGLVGELHAGVRKNYDLNPPIFIFEIDLGRVAAHIPDQKQSVPVSTFPATSRDVTLIVDRVVESQAILDHVRNADEELVESLHFFDVFDGDPIPPSKKSISFRITYRSRSETLEDDRINDIHGVLTEKLLDAFDAAFPT